MLTIGMGRSFYAMGGDWGGPWRAMEGIESLMWGDDENVFFFVFYENVS